MKYILNCIVSLIQEELNLSLPSDSFGWLYHLNYPRTLPGRTNYTQHITAPVGYVIFLEIFGVGFSENRCSGDNSLEVIMFLILFKKTL